MNASASLAERLVRKSAGRYLLRPEPHRFADFRVLRHAEVPAVLFEAGYISNIDDEALLLQPEKSGSGSSPRFGAGHRSRRRFAHRSLSSSLSAPLQRR